MKSKKISNDQKLIQSDPTSCLKTKGKLNTKIHSSLRKARVVNPMNSSFLDRWSFIYLKYVTNIIGEPKYKYGQQEQVTVRNRNRSTALERSVIKYWGGGRGRGGIGLYGSKHIVSCSVRVMVF